MWYYSATIWTLGPDEEGWRSESGDLIYCDGMIGRVKVIDGPDDKHHVIEAPLHCIYVQVPAIWFINAVTITRPSRGTYGADFFEQASGSGAPSGVSSRRGMPTLNSAPTPRRNKQLDDNI